MRLASAALAVLLAACGSAARKDAAASAPSGPRPGRYAVLTTDAGAVDIRLFKDDAPRAVAAFEAAAAAKSFDGAGFGRAVPGYLVQAAARGGGEVLPLETAPGRTFARPGAVAAPSEGGSARGAEFFVTLVPAPWLDGKHTVFGEVTAGLEVLAGAARTPLLIRSVSLEDRR